MDAPFATFIPHNMSPCYQPSAVATNGMSPVFDFDQAWAEHVTALRSTTKLSTMGGCEPSPSSAVTADAFMMELQYDGVACAPQQAVQSQWAEPSVSAIPGAWDPSFQWADEQWSGVRQFYGAYSTSPQGMSSSHSFPSSASTSTLGSPTTSRGSKRSSAETSPTSSSSNKRRRVGSQSQSEQVSKRSLFYLDEGEDDEEASAYQGPWEILQGAWDASVVSPDMPPQIAPVIRVREMPTLQEPAPRLPAQVWEPFKL